MKYAFFSFLASFFASPSCFSALLIQKTFSTPFYTFASLNVVSLRWV